MDWLRGPRLLWMAAAFVSVGLATSEARAGCPDEGSPSAAVCAQSSAMLLPTAVGLAYAPLEGQGPWFGGGVQLVLLTWADSSPHFGPSHGKLRFDAGLLRSRRDGAGTMAMYRGGASVSFERNPSRNWLIPYFGAGLGGLWVTPMGSEGFVDASLGLYVLYLRSAIIDLEASYLLPFDDADLLAGPKIQLAVSFALW